MPEQRMHMKMPKFVLAHRGCFVPHSAHTLLSGCFRQSSKIFFTLAASLLSLLIAAAVNNDSSHSSPQRRRHRGAVNASQPQSQQQRIQTPHGWTGEINGRCNGQRQRRQWQTHSREGRGAQESGDQHCNAGVIQRAGMRTDRRTENETERMTGVCMAYGEYNSTTRNGG